MTTTTHSLTDRYVDALVGRLPVKQRADIEQELRASIADAVDNHVDAGSDPADAERAVLTEFGDPARLAARYAGRPLQLIGPAFYLDYVRLLTALLTIVVPVVTGVVAFAHVRRGSDPGPAIADTLGVAIATAVHIGFWTTLLFAALERVPGLRPTAARQWTPDALPEPAGPSPDRSTLVKHAIAAAGFVGFIVVVRAVKAESPPPWQDAGFYMLLGWVGAFLAAAAVQVYLRWSVLAALVRWLLNLAGVALMVWLVVDQTFDPARTFVPGTPPEFVRWVDVGFLAAAGVMAVLSTATAAASFVTKSWAAPGWKSLVRTFVDSGIKS